MSRSIDSRVVQLAFENETFERGVSQSLTSLNRLNSSITDFAKGAAFTGLDSAIHGIAKSFTVSGQASIRIIQRITDAVIDLGTKMAKNLVVPPSMHTGFQEYELKMGSLQTIMAGTGEDLATVNKYLNELNKYSDETIYSFSDMTQNIGKFTNAGVKLETAVGAIKGIANAAALAGASSWEASRAMYNFAQSIAGGFVKYIDWKSIEMANMATVEFKQYLLDTAVAMGTVRKSSNGMYESLTTNARGKTSGPLRMTQMFSDALSYQWMTTEVLTKALNDYADPMTEIGKRATEAAKRVSTLSKLMDTLGEAMQSGWAATHEIIFGDFDEATKLWTSISELASKYIEHVAKARNESLQFWVEQGGKADFLQSLVNVFLSLYKIIDQIRSAWREVFPPRLKETVVAFGRAMVFLTGKLVPTERFLAKVREESVKLFTQLKDGLLVVRKVMYVLTELAILALPLVETAFRKAFSGIQKVFITIRDVLSTVGQYAKDVINTFATVEDTDKALAIIQDRWGFFGKTVAEAMHNIVTAIGTVLMFLRDLFVVSKGIQNISDAVYVMGYRWGTIGKVITAVFYIIKAIVKGLAIFTVTMTKITFTAIKLYNAFGDMNNVLYVIERRFGALGVLFADSFRFIWKYVSLLYQGFNKIRMSITSFFKNLNEALRILDEFKTIDGSLLSIERNFGKVGKAFVAVYRPIYTAVKGIMAFFDLMRAFVNEAIDAFLRWWSVNIFDDMIKSISAFLRLMRDEFLGFVNSVLDYIGGIVDGILGIGRAIRQFFSDVGFLAQLTPKLGTVDGALMMIENRLGTFGMAFVRVYKIAEPLINLLGAMFDRLEISVYKVAEAFIEGGFAAGIKVLKEEIHDLIFNNPIANFFRDLKKDIMKFGKDNPFIKFISQFDGVYSLILGVLDSVAKAFSDVSKDNAFINFLGFIANLFTTIYDILSKIDVNNIRESIAQGIVGIINILTDGVAAIDKLLNSLFKSAGLNDTTGAILEFFASMVSGVASAFAALGSIGDVKVPATQGFLDRILNLGRDMSLVDESAKKSTGIIASLGRTLHNLGLAIASVFEIVSSVARVATTGIASFLEHLSLLDVISAAIAASFVSLLFNVGQIAGGIANIFQNAGGVLKSTSNLLDTLSDRLSPVARFAITINGIIVLIISLTLSILALSRVPIGQLVKAVGSIGVLMLILVSSLKSLEDVKGQNIKALAFTIVAIGVAINMLTKAASALGSMDVGVLIKGMAAVGALGLGITAAIYAFVKIKPMELVGIASSIIALSVGLRILSPAIKSLGEIDFWSLVKGLTATSYGIAALVLPFILLSKFGNGKKLAKLGMNIIAIAVAMRILGGAIAVVANSKHPLYAATAFISILGTISEIMGRMSTTIDNKSMKILSTGLLKISVSFALLFAALLPFTLLNLPSLGLALLAIVGIIGAFAGLGIIITQMPIFRLAMEETANAFLKFGKSVLYIGGGIAALSIGLMLLGTAGTVGAMGILSFAAIIGNNMLVFLKAGAALILVSGSIALLGIGLTSLAAGIFALNMNSYRALKTLGYMVLAFIAVGALMHRFMDAVLGVTVSFAIISGSFYLLSKTLKAFKEYGVTNLLIVLAAFMLFGVVMNKNAEAMTIGAVLIVGLAGALWILNSALGGTTFMMAALVAAAAGAVVAFAALMYVLDSVDGKRIGQNFVDIGAAIAQGLIKGIIYFIPFVIETFVNMCRSAYQGILEFFGIASPSKLMEGVGINICEGLTDGLERGWDWIKDKVVNFGEKVWNAIRHPIDTLKGYFSATAAEAADMTNVEVKGVNTEGLNKSLDETNTKVKDGKEALNELTASSDDASAGFKDLESSTYNAVISTNEMKQSTDELNNSLANTNIQIKENAKAIQDANAANASMTDSAENARKIQHRNLLQGIRENGTAFNALQNIIDDGYFLREENIHELGFFGQQVLTAYASINNKMYDFQDKVLNNENKFLNNILLNNAKRWLYATRFFAKNVLNIDTNILDGVKKYGQYLADDVGIREEQFALQIAYEKSLNKELDVMKRLQELREEDRQNRIAMGIDSYDIGKDIGTEEGKGITDGFSEQTKKLGLLPSIWQKAWTWLREKYPNEKDFPSLISRFMGDESKETMDFKKRFNNVLKGLLGYFGIDTEFLDFESKGRDIADNLLGGMSDEEKAKEAGEKTGKSYLAGLSAAVDDLDKKWITNVFSAGIRDKIFANKRSGMVKLLQEYNDTLSERQRLESDIAKKKFDYSGMSILKEGFAGMAEARKEIQALEKQLNRLKSSTINDVNAENMAKRLAEQEKQQRYLRAYSEKYEEYSYKKKLVKGRLPQEVIDELKAKYLEDPKAILAIKRRNWDAELKAEKKAEDEARKKADAKKGITPKTEPAKEETKPKPKAEEKKEEKDAIKTAEKDISKLDTKVKDLATETKKTVVGLAANLRDEGGKAVSETLNAVVGGINKEHTSESLKTSVASWINTIKSEVQLKQEEIKAIGLSITAGMANGMLSGNSLVINAAQKIAQTAIDNSKVTLKESSPSKVFMEIGAYCTKGLAQGLTNSSSMNTLEGGIDKLSDFISGLANKILIDPAKNLSTNIIDKINQSIDNWTNKVRGTSSKQITDDELKALNDLRTALNNINVSDLNPKITPIIDLTNVNDAANRLDQVFQNRTIEVDANTSRAKANSVNRMTSTALTQEITTNKSKIEPNKTTNNLTVNMNNTVKTDTDIRKISNELNQLLIKYGYAKGKSL